jgi:subtilisin family serine protease
MRVPLFRLLVLIAFATTVTLAVPSALSAPKTHPRRLLVLPAENAPHGAAPLLQKHATKGIQVRRTYPELNGLQVIELPPGLAKKAVAEDYLASGLAQRVEEDGLISLSRTPNDPLFTQNSLWGLHNSGGSGRVADGDIDAPEAWDTQTSAAGVIVAVVDSGVRYTHEDLAPNMWVNPREVVNGRDDDGNGFIDDIHGINAAVNSGNPADDNGHGTHVAGTIGAVGNNGKGSVGVAWTVKLMALRFMDASGNGYTSDAIECIDYARRNGARIINASWGSGTYSAALETAIRSARDAGIVFVAAAGNNAANNDLVPVYPANSTLANVVTVAATSSADSLDTSYSNFGAASVDVAAPGTGIASTWHTSDAAYATLTGTSMAAPHVSGILALLAAKFPSDTYQQRISRLMNNTDLRPSLAGKCRTGGRANLHRALAVSGATVAQGRGTAKLLSAGLEVTFAGSPGAVYDVQASTDCKTWTSVSTVTAGVDGLVRYVDASRPPGSMRFYRTVLR